MIRWINWGLVRFRETNKPSIFLFSQCGDPNAVRIFRDVDLQGGLVRILTEGGIVGEMSQTIVTLQSSFTNDLIFNFCLNFLVHFRIESLCDFESSL